MKVYQSVTELIGRTPLLEVKNIERAKKVYNAIKVPEQISYVINKSLLKEKNKKKFWKGLLYGEALFL